MKDLGCSYLITTVSIYKISHKKSWQKGILNIRWIINLSSVASAVARIVLNISRQCVGWALLAGNYQTEFAMQ